MVDDRSPLVPPHDAGRFDEPGTTSPDQVDPPSASSAAPIDAPVDSPARADDDEPGPGETPRPGPIDCADQNPHETSAVAPADAAYGAGSEQTEPTIEDIPQESDESLAADASDRSSIESLGSEIIDRLEALHRYVVESAGVEEHQAELLQKLHAENVSLREGELTQALKPIILDLARLHDDVASVITRGGEGLQKAAVIPELILDVLDRHGVSQIKPSAGEPFDGKQHQGVRGVPTSDSSLDGTIESVIRLGFIRDRAHLVRPAQVAVYRHTQSAEQVMAGDEDEPESTSVEDAAPETTTNTEQPGRGQIG